MPLCADAGKARIRGLLAARLADGAAEGFGRAELVSARFALDGEGRAEAGIARRAPRAHLSAALRARLGQLALGLVEVALREPADQAEGDPVAEGLAALFAEPLRGLTHIGTRGWRGRAERGFARGMGSPVLSHRESCGAPRAASPRLCPLGRLYSEAQRR